MGYYWMRFGTGARRVLDFPVEDNSRWGEPEGIRAKAAPHRCSSQHTFLPCVGEYHFDVR